MNLGIVHSKGSFKGPFSTLFCFLSLSFPISLQSLSIRSLSVRSLSLTHTQFPPLSLPNCGNLFRGFSAVMSESSPPPLPSHPPPVEGTVASSLESIRLKKLEKEEEDRKKKEERLKSFLGEPLSSSNTNEEELGQSSSLPPSIPKAQRRGSVRGIWNNVINESHNKEQDRTTKIKNQTISQFRTTDGTGIVKKRVGEWEELFMQIQASAKQIIATVEAGKAAALSLSAMKVKSSSSSLSSDPSLTSRSLNMSGNDDDDHHHDNIISENYILNSQAEEFASGSTRVYGENMMGMKSCVLITKTVSSNHGRPCALPCGVYSEGKQPPIDIVAVAMRTDDDNTHYIALTITVSEGFEYDDSAYGNKKVAIFLSGSDTPIFERVVDITPRQVSTNEYEYNLFFYFSFLLLVL